MKHLKETGESYFEHMFFSLCYAFLFFFTTVAMVVHALIPFMFDKRASMTCTSVQNSIKRRVIHERED